MNWMVYVENIGEVEYNINNNIAITYQVTFVQGTLF